MADGVSPGAKHLKQKDLAEPRVSRLSSGVGLSWKQVAVVLWLTFSVALATWWMIFGLQQVDRVQNMMKLSPVSHAEDFARQHQMLVMEGATLVFLLLIGGGSLLYYINTEIRRTRRVREFFAAFTHDLKTSLASLRLQAESLEEDLKNSGQERLVKRLVKDTVRIELQLENSLLLASPGDNSRFLMESLHVSEVLQSMQHQWPDLKLTIQGDAFIEADRRAFDSICKNLLQNSVVHGRSTEVSIQVKPEGSLCRIRFEDNGRGFKGERRKLGTMFERHASSSGSGLGLYLATELAKKMSGSLTFPVTDGSGFVVEVYLPFAKGEAP